MAIVTVKCRNCGKIIDKNSAHKVGKTSYYCDADCFEQKEKERIKTKTTYEPKDNTDRLKLTDFILELFLEQGYDKTEINWNMICSQIKNLIESYTDYEDKPYSYGGIKYCLGYMKDIESVNLFNDDSKGSILNLVPFYYNKSKQFWYECDRIKKLVKEVEFDDEIIVIKKSKRLPKNTEIDLSEI